MSQEYQLVYKFVQDQVKIFQKPITFDKKLLSILEKYGDDHSLRKSQLVQVLQKVNLKLSNHYGQYYSSQAVTQLCDQILQLWEEEKKQQEELLKNLESTDICVDLQSDYKIHSLREIISQIDNLPELEAKENNDAYEAYSVKRRDLIEKVQRLEKLRKNNEILEKYEESINLKVGDRETILKNIPSSRNDKLSREITKLKIILEKFKGLDHTKLEKLRKTLASQT